MNSTHRSLAWVALFAAACGCGGGNGNDDVSLASARFLVVGMSTSGSGPDSSGVWGSAEIQGFAMSRLLERNANGVVSGPTPDLLAADLDVDDTIRLWDLVADEVILKG